MSTIIIGQRTNTKNTDGTAQREWTQRSCRHDHELMKDRFRIIYINYIETIQRTQEETLILIQRDTKNINGIRKETGGEYIYHTEYKARMEQQFTGREQGISQSAPLA